MCSAVLEVCREESLRRGIGASDEVDVEDGIAMLVQDAVAVEPQQSGMTDDATSLSQVQITVSASTTGGPILVHSLPSPGGQDYGQHPSPSSGHPQPDAPDTKEGIEELCPVCGDKVSGYHYGLLTCESCKGFFKRTVQNKKVYTCVADRGCHIDKSQRKRCPYCRFQKCLDVGMKLEAVRADRMRGGRNKFGPMYKRDRARRLQMMRQKQIARNQCPGGGATSPDGICVLSSPPFPPTSGGGQPPFYADSPGGVKQELIQIPQLSSSTSSPDSSPSPLAINAGVNPFGPPPPTQANQQQQLTIQTAPPGSLLSSPNKGVWPGNPPCSPSPPLVVGHHPVSSPKGYHHQQPPQQQQQQHPHPQQQQPQQQQQHAPSEVNLLTGHVSAASSGGGQQQQQQNGLVLVGSNGPASKMSGLIREFQLCMPDDKEWHTQLFSLLQDQTYNQCEVDLFELMCKVIDQALFGQVDWARNSIFFKELKVDDQMKLLQHSWSDMLILDHLHQRLHHGLPDETTLPNGQKFDLLTLALLGLPSMAEHLHRVAARLQELKWDPLDYICVKFLLLLNPEVRGLSNMKLVHEAHEQAQQTLMEYSLNCYPQITDKFGLLLQQLPEIHLMGMRGEEFLYFRHLSGSASSQTLLMEMLHAKKK